MSLNRSCPTAADLRLPDFFATNRMMQIRMIAAMMRRIAIRNSL
jgi:hypothetical protein